MNATETTLTIMIFEEMTGRFHLSDASLPYRDATGYGYLTRAEATHAAIEMYNPQCDHLVLTGSGVSRHVARQARVSVKGAR